MKIVFHKKFNKKFEKLPQKTKEKFYEKLTLFEINQFDQGLNNHRVNYPYLGCRSINITGDIRALYEAIADTVTFIYIGTHSELYK